MNNTRPATLQTKSLQHVGIIMDGNGRWAKKRGLPRIAGHSEGVKTSKRIVKQAAACGLPFLSLYVFSSENWKRSSSEISHLMGLIKAHLRNELDFYVQNKIRVWHSGDLSDLPKSVQDEILFVLDATKDFDGLTVNLLINYGGQDEIARAAEKLRLSETPISCESLRSMIFHGKELPPVDLIIRTGGEQRLSNFLLWDSAYAEYAFEPKLWPDWSEEDFMAILHDFEIRERRFGSAK